MDDMILRRAPPFSHDTGAELSCLSKTVIVATSSKERSFKVCFVISQHIAAAIKSKAVFIIFDFWIVLYIIIPFKFSCVMLG